MGISANALFSKTQQRVLAVLFGQPQRSFYANEIIALADCGSGAVQRELSKLEAAALVTVRRQGNQKHFQANQDAPTFVELHGIVVKRLVLPMCCAGHCSCVGHAWIWRLSMARWPAVLNTPAVTWI